MRKLGIGEPPVKGQLHIIDTKAASLVEALRLAITSLSRNMRARETGLDKEAEHGRCERRSHAAILELIRYGYQPDPTCIMLKVARYIPSHCVSDSRHEHGICESRHTIGNPSCVELSAFRVRESRIGEKATVSMSVPGY
jgi:hypothetical protein